MLHIGKLVYYLPFFLLTFFNIFQIHNTGSGTFETL